MATNQPHYQETPQPDIDLIRNKVIEILEWDKRALTDAIDACKTCNLQLAYSIIPRDERIDELENEIDRLCLKSLTPLLTVARRYTRIFRLLTRLKLTLLARLDKLSRSLRVGPDFCSFMGRYSYRVL